MQRSHWFKLALPVAGIAVVLLVAETLIRVAVPSARWRFREASEDWQTDPELGWTQRPMLRTARRVDDQIIRFETNADGVQPATATRQRSKPYRVLLIGDSTVVGRSVPEEQRLHVRLQQALASRGLVSDVINGGVEAYATDQSLLRMERLLPLYRPDVVIYSLCDNDFGGNALGEAYGLPKPHFALVKGVAVYRPPPYHVARIARSSAGPRDWLQRSALYRMLQPGLVVARARLGRWEEKSLAGLATEYYYNSVALEALDWTLMSALVQRMSTSARQHGALFAAYSMPALDAVWEPHIQATLHRQGLTAGRYHRDALEARLARATVAWGGHVIPLVARFSARQAEGPFHLLPTDPHNNGAGYRVIADGLAEWVATVGHRP